MVIIIAIAALFWGLMVSFAIEHNYLPSPHIRLDFSMPPFPSPKLQYKLAVAEIQQHRQSKIALWRSCFTIGCVLSLGLLTASSLWEIEDPSQIQIAGNQLVGQQTIHEALGLTYPQFVWAVEIKNLAQKVESVPSIEVANVNRQIIPPIITISVRERIPQAIATSDGKMGFLDVDGKWVGQEFYTDLDRAIDRSSNSNPKSDRVAQNFTLPKLIVHNYQSRYQKSWIELYQLISLYPELKIDKVQWNQSGNLFLQTKLGKVSLGTNSSRLEKQFEIMLKLQNLSDRVDRDRIAYIDLSNPNLNLIQRY